VTAFVFLVTRALAEGVRVFAIAIVISVVLNTSEIPSTLLIVALPLFFTFEGGLTPGFATVVVQMALYVAGALLSFWILLDHIPGGWAHVVAVAAPAGQFRIFDFAFAWTRQFFARPYTFWAGVLGGCFLTTASHGTDQLIVQRLLSARSESESRLALLASWGLVALKFTLFLLVGIALFVYHRDTGLAAPPRPDRIYPEFVWHHLPAGVAGLVIAA